MACKFEVGDRVKVVKMAGPADLKAPAAPYLGRTGVVEQYYSLNAYPYEVSFRGGYEMEFKASELEAVPRSGKRPKKKSAKKRKK